MAKLSITNRSGKAQYLRSTSGETVEIQPEATETVEIDRENLHLKALENAHLVTVDDGSAEKAVSPKKSSSKKTKEATPQMPAADAQEADPVT